MPSLKDDIDAARKSGKSDEYLLDAYKAYDPEKASDIDAGLKSGANPSLILDALGAYDAQYGNHIENQGLLAKATGALQQGVADEFRGIGATAKETLGQGDVSDTLNAVGSAAAPRDYQPAPEGLGDTTKAIGDRAGYIPRSMVEGAPGLATDLAAGYGGARAGAALGLLGGPFAEMTVPAGAAIGGIAGFGGSYFLRNYGKDAQRAAQARTGDLNAVPNTEDKQRALVAGTVGAAMSRVGVTKALGASIGEAGAKALIPSVAAMAKAGAIDAGTSVAADAANTAILDQRDPTDDAAGLALSGAQGAIAGGGLRAVTAAGDLRNAAKFSGIDPEHAAALRKWYEDQDDSTPAKAFDAVKHVDGHLGLHADHWAERAQPQIDDLNEANGHLDDTELAVKMARARLARGTVIDPMTLHTLNERLGAYKEGYNLVEVLTLQNTQNQLKALGNFREDANGTGTFGGGIGDTDFLSPLGTLGKYAERALGHTLGSGVHLLQWGTKLALDAFDKALQSDNPLAAYNRHFDARAMAIGSERPSFTQRQAVEDGTAEAAKALAQKAALVTYVTQRHTTDEPIDPLKVVSTLNRLRQRRT